MTQQPNPSPTPTSQALSRMPMFGPPPLVQGEDAAAYDDLLARVSGNLKPSDIFEEIWVREIVDLIWENLRWRRHLARCLESNLPKVLEDIIRPLMQNEPAAPAGGKSWVGRIDAAYDRLSSEQDLVRRFTAGDQDAIKRVNELLASVNLTMEHVTAQAAARELETIERFNRLIANTEWRRNALLREIERRRASFAQKLWNGIDDLIIGAKFETVDATTAAPPAVAH